MDASYNIWIVLISLILAVGASFVALNLAARIPHIPKSSFWYWLTGGAVAMGLGIWSMHFVGMLAIHLPIPLAYDIGLTLVSIVFAVLASAISLYIVRNGIRDTASLVFSAVLMGAGIAGMHYTGMAALNMFPPIRYDPLLFTVSLIIAFAASFFALKLSFSVGGRDASVILNKDRIVASVIMGGAIAGMHYTGMLAARFSGDSVCLAVKDGLSSGVISVLVVLGVILILIFTLMLLMVDLKLAEKDRLLLDTLIKHNEELKERAESIAEQMTHELQESAHRDHLLATIVEQSADAIITKDLEGRVTSWNAAAKKMFGYSTDEILNQDIRILYPSESETVSRQKLTMLEVEGDSEITARRKTRDGQLLDVVITASYLYDSDRNRIGDIGIIRDVTEKRKADEQLMLWASVFEHSGEAIMITDRENRVISVNSSFADITGYQLDEVIGRNPHFLASGRHDGSFYAAMWASLQGEGVWRGEIWNKKKSGEIFPERLTITTIKDIRDSVRNYIAIFSDISEQKEREEYIHHLAHHDALTGLPNRTLLRDRMEQAFIHASRHGDHVAVMFIDLDRFKIINDTMGHETGDQLLVVVAQRLLRLFRDGDTVCRLGGDEFIVLLPEIRNSGNLVTIAEKVLEELSQHYEIEDYELDITPSIGISLYPDDGNDIDEIISHADAAMYHAKEQGRSNFQFFTTALNKMVNERLVMETELHQALGNDEFELHFQPQFRLTDQTLSGVEALIRWQSPKLGAVPPDKFIPLAEEIGMIHKIGEWVMQTACEAGSHWHKRFGFSGRIAVNVSVKQLNSPEFNDQVMQILQTTGMASAMLEIELTETALMETIEHSARVLKLFRDKGVTISIDDFGTGYSSLNYLRRLPLDVLKIDRSLIGELPEVDEEREIANAIIAMAKGMHLRVVAEGVERDQQAEYLKLAGCDEVQGYYYCHPLPRSEFENYLADNL
jgi:diguanylate cyclase (GGDEF)-like protein/PAS domain S-box-containing protein